MSQTPHRLKIVDAPRDPEKGRGGEAAFVDSSGNGDVGEALLLVGEFAKAAGKTVRAIHLYEDLGLLRPHERSKGRYRLFSADALTRVRWISKLQNLGFSLSDIQRLVKEQQSQGSAVEAAAKLRHVYVAKLAEARKKIDELQHLKGELEASLAFLDACDAACHAEASMQQCPTCERHAEGDVRPDLVAGAQTSLG